MTIDRTRPEAPRSRLMRQLDTFTSKKIVYIHAPAGYGKTFSVKLWFKHSGIANSWLLFGDKRNEEQGTYFRAGAQAFLRIQPDNVELREIAEHPLFDTSPYEFLLRAAKALKNDGGECVIVCDDVHLVKENERIQTLIDIIRLLPENFTMFILSRSTPHVLFSEFIMRETMAIVDSDSLKFTPDEIRDYFRDCGHKLSRSEAESIYSSTNGWAIGINALLLADGKAINKKLAENYFDTFLRDKVWALWDERFKGFMIKASVVPELTPQCAAALTGVEESKKLLDELLLENAFISVDAAGVYRFHDLFRDFLLHMLDKHGEPAVNGQYNKAADWFYIQKDYYRAIEYYVKSKNDNGTAKSLLTIYYNPFGISFEAAVAIFRGTVDKQIIEKVPLLLEVQAWVEFADGNPAEFEKSLDEYYKAFPQILLRHPSSVAMFNMLYRADYRNSVAGRIAAYHNTPLSEDAKASLSSFTINMPFMHRAGRDCSDYVLEPPEVFDKYVEIIGSLVQDDTDIRKGCILAGLEYEKGNLNEAHGFAIAANTNIRGESTPEIKFSAKMILASVYAAQGQIKDSRKVIDSAAKMIEESKAFYLNANFEAYKCRIKLEDGDEEAAREWLERSPPEERIPFYKLYRLVTTARALICVGEYNAAMQLLHKILSLVEAYRRPLDIIEANILLAIAYWKRGRGYQKDATSFLERAISDAERYSFTQIFISESAELCNMLQKLQLHIQKNKYEGAFSDAFVKPLCISVLAESKRSKGLTGGRMPKALKFTAQQLAVMRHLCDGLTYREIAVLLGISYEGVRSHMQLIYKKLDAPNNVEAVKKIREHKILDEQAVY